MYRASVSVVQIYQQVLIAQSDGVCELVNFPAGAGCDTFITKLLGHALPDHSAHVRAGQCVTIAALDLLFAPVHPALTPAAVTLASLLEVAQVSSEDAFAVRIPGSKIAALGVFDFVKYATLLRPTV
jgi:hypothetical protein